jgi:hypothetical protein
MCLAQVENNRAIHQRHMGDFVHSTRLRLPDQSAQ